MAKKTAKRHTKSRKKPKYSCKVCGLLVTVDNICGCVDYCDIVCCGEEMKPKR